MNSNVYLDFLKFIIEVIFLNIVLSVLANNVPITTPIDRIILVVIAILLTIILFYLQVVRHQRPGSLNTAKNRIILAVIAFLVVILFGTLIWPKSPNYCTLSPESANYLSTGDTSLITKKIPNEKDREQQIYDNNKDLNDNNSYLLAVAIPANTQSQAAKAMLVGVADAQTKFNQHDPTKPTISKKRLKIVVVDDQNNKDFAKEVACQIAQNPKWKNILGVIGHHSSGASIAALDIYDKAAITMITPTSTSTSLNQESGNKAFFRTTVTNADFGKILADKIYNLEGKVSVFYEGNNKYAEDLKQQFINVLGGIKVAGENNIQYWNNADIDTLTIPNNVKTAVIFSSSGDGQKHDIAIKLIKKLKSIRRGDLNLFGGDSLFKGQTLSEGKTDIEGLKLVIPWFRVKDGQIISDYAKKSEATWRGSINWMTASSYDATQAFLAAIAKIEQTPRKVERKSVLDSMPNVYLEPKDTSGAGLKFDNGEPKDFDNGKLKDRKPIFVEVVQKEKLPKILQCNLEVCFKPVE